MSDLLTAICSVAAVLFVGIVARELTGWDGVEGATMFIAGSVWRELQTKRTLRELARQIAKEPRR